MSFKFSLRIFLPSRLNYLFIIVYLFIQVPYCYFEAPSPVGHPDRAARDSGSEPPEKAQALRSGLVLFLGLP